MKSEGASRLLCFLAAFLALPGRRPGLSWGMKTHSGHLESDRLPRHPDAGRVSPDTGQGTFGTRHDRKHQGCARIY